MTEQPIREQRSRIAITGAIGFVGRRVVTDAIARGHEVVALCRRDPERGLLPREAEVRLTGDLDASPNWGAALSGVDAVVHLAARVHMLGDRATDPLAEHRRMNRDATLRLAEAAVASGVRRFVFMSTIKVNGEATGSVPFSDTSVPAPVDPYGISKAEAEEGLQEIATRTGLEVVVIRPPLVYGPGVKANFLRLLQAVERGVPLPLASVRNRRSMIFVGNLSDAVIRAVVSPRAAGGTYLVSDGPALSTPDLIREIGQAFGRPARLIPIPPGLMRLLGGLTGRSAAVGRLLGSLEIDDQGIREQLDWAPPFTVREGLRQTVAWWREH